MRGRSILWIAVVVVAAMPSVAQQTPDASPILTLDQERMYTLSEFGKRVQTDLEAQSQALAAENRAIADTLIEEERRLTDERAEMEVGEFRALALDFDERVTAIRKAQDDKEEVIQNRVDQERARFFELAFPVLLKLVEETNAVAILDDSAVIFSVRQIDITDAAIARINETVGAAPPTPETGPPPIPRPAPEVAQ